MPRSRGIFAAAILVVATAQGGDALAGPAPPKAKSWAITVGPGPCDLTENGQACPKQAISKTKQHKIVWTSNAGQSLVIVVHVPASCPAPFKKMTKTGTDSQGNVLWSVDCKDNQCNSGPAVKEACEQDYKYDQVLGGKTCDGWIIIDK